MKFISTNGRAAPVDLQTALLAGLAPDGGLYFPEEIESAPIGRFDACATLPAGGRASS